MAALAECVTLSDQRECELNCSRYLRDFEAIGEDQVARMRENGLLDERRRLKKLMLRATSAAAIGERAWTAVGSTVVVAGASCTAAGAGAFP